ncbi:MAG: 4-hydroxybutyryl-CoA dehydratase, partial [Deltaproteobacteria bacterium]|nr:4-hydroxybutyryl-CoA dehydratase [Deltaproteobacteria bacterium]
MIRTFEEYKASLQDSREVYYRGKAVEDVTEHPLLKLEMEPVKYMFKDEYRFFNEDFGTESSIFYRIPHNAKDLAERSQMTYDITKDMGMLWPHIGSDALLAARVSTCELDTAERFAKYHKYVVENNLFLCGAQIDVRGDRSKRPLKQNDPDTYVHVVEEREDGIVVKGAKFHTSMTVISNEIFVLPGRALREGEEDYALCFAVTPSTQGVKVISRPAVSTEAAQHPAEGMVSLTRRMGETLTIFDNVFVPWDRVFIYKDTKAASFCALLFALMHRLSAVSYRSALAEDLIGLAMLMAEANGVQKASHIARDITDIIMFNEIQRVCALEAARSCEIHEKSGVAIPNKIVTNVGKLYSNSNYLNVIQSLLDVTGGIAISAPSGHDYDNPELRPYIEKYLQGAVPGDERFKLALLIREICALLIGEMSVIM